jgi:hypothetical protein
MGAMKRLACLTAVSVMASVACAELVTNPDFDARSASWSVLSQWGGPHFYTDGADTIASVGGRMWNTFGAFNKVHTNER